MVNSWEDEEVAFLENRLLHEPKLTYMEFCSEFGTDRSYDAVRKKINRLRDIASAGATEVTQPKQLSPIDLIDPRIMKQQALVWLSSIGSSFKGTQRAIKPTPRTLAPTLVIVVSDTHIGKLTNTFNSNVAVSRILSIPSEILANNNVLDIDSIKLVLGGDLNEGEDIFPTQNGIIEAPVITQSKICTEAIWQLALDLQETFDVPVEIETSPGNHGRQSKTANPKSNWDNAVYQSLGLLCEYARPKGISIDVNLENFKVLEIKDKRILLNHEGVKHLGTPATQVKLAGWIISKQIDALIHGHWHQKSFDSFMGRTRISNGSLCGGDDLSEEMGKEEPPSQVYFTVQPNRPITNLSSIEW